MFAWALEPHAETVRTAMREEFARHRVEIDDWVVAIESRGARIVAATGQPSE
jgi:hypothetical protein